MDSYSTTIIDITAWNSPQTTVPLGVPVMDSCSEKRFPHFHVLHFPSLQFGADFSCSAISCLIVSHFQRPQMQTTQLVRSSRQLANNCDTAQLIIDRIIL